jgi:His-Xaa-Ser system radical SAM maturase HxsB
LPLRFTAIDAGRYVATNIAGEYLVLTREQLTELIGHRIGPGDLYDELKARHFIYDNDSRAAIELLGLKYRTKLSHVSRFTALHMFVVTLRCDYTCKYCQVSRQTEDRHAYDMSEETANLAVAMTFQSPAHHIKIEFQGGEPLLNFERIRHVVQAAKELNRQYQRDLQFVVASNLSLLSDEILDFCDRESIYFSTSLDGPADLHNANRPRPGKNGHALTVAGIERIRNRLGVDRVSALMTTTDRSLKRPREIIDEYVRLGFNSIFLRPLSPYGFAVSTGQVDRYNADNWLAFYKEGLDYILDLNRRGVPMRETYSSIVLRKMLTPASTGYVDLQSPAGIGISGIVYNYDGKVYASDEARMLAEMGDTSFQLGHLGADSYEEMMLSDALLNPLEASLAEGVPNCVDCAFLPYCGSDPVYHHATQGDAVGNKAISGFCHRNMEVFRHLIGRMEDSPQDRRILQSWAL